MKTLDGFLKSVASLTKPKIWTSSLDKVTKEHDHLREMINKGETSIYGVNTRPGHRDGEKLELIDLDAYQHDLLSSHAISFYQPYYSDHAATCITFAKVYSIASGMTGVSPALFKSLADLAINPKFAPRIPQHSSYSSGDVIPAAHWAIASLNELSVNSGYTAQYGEGMALINGNFIQVGYAASIVEKISLAWLLFVELCSISTVISKANASNLFLHSSSNNSLAIAALDLVRDRAAMQQKDIQDPVSIRAAPQIIDTLAGAIEGYLDELDSSLLKPSGNPLFCVSSKEPLSQASFLLPSLTIKTGGLVEALLFTMWAITGRTNHLLSGSVEGVPKDAANETSSLGLIQYPKYMMSTLEKARLDYGRRIFSSGSSTSYGTEDLWNCGVNALSQLDSLLEAFLNICFCELYIYKYVQHHHSNDAVASSPLLSALLPEYRLRDVPFVVREILEIQRLPEHHGLFPVATGISYSTYTTDQTSGEPTHA